MQTEVFPQNVCLNTQNAVSPNVLEVSLSNVRDFLARIPDKISGKISKLSPPEVPPDTQNAVLTTLPKYC